MLLRSACAAPMYVGVPTCFGEVSRVLCLSMRRLAAEPGTLAEHFRQDDMQLPHCYSQGRASGLQDGRVGSRVGTRRRMHEIPHPTAMHEPENEVELNTHKCAVGNRVNHKSKLSAIVVTRASDVRRGRRWHLTSTETLSIYWPNHNAIDWPRRSPHPVSTVNAHISDEVEDRERYFA